MSEINIYEEKRPWGHFRQFIKNSPCTVKIFTVNPNEAVSLQTHGKRAEFWRVIGGSGTMQIGEKVYEVKQGDEYKVAVNEKHRVTAGREGIDVLEVATGEFDEADIVRIEDKYGRA